MEQNEKQKKRFEEELRRLDSKPDKPCRWKRQRLPYDGLWMVGFIWGVIEGVKLKN